MIASTYSTRQADCLFVDTDHPFFQLAQAFVPPLQQPNGVTYLERYFAPWCDPHCVDVHAIRVALEGSLGVWTQIPHYTGNAQPVNFDWIAQQKCNSNLSHWVEVSKAAILVADVDVRLLPTHEPLFRAWDTPTDSDIQGYPFDRLQHSWIPAYTPVVVIHSSQDKKWLLIVSSTVWGWVKRESLAWVSVEWMAQWLTGHYVVSLQDQTIALSDPTLPSVGLRLGQIYSVCSSESEAYCIQFAVRDVKGHAVIIPACIPQDRLSRFPLAMTARNMSMIGQQFLGQPYGWGGLYGYRDCSSMVMDFMAMFGIWLPRNSNEQMLAIPGVSLSHCDTAHQKELYIIEHGIPFLSLLYAPGHIGLYVGVNADGRAMMLHSVWRQARGVVVTNLDFENKVGQTLLEQMASLHYVFDRA